MVRVGCCGWPVARERYFERFGAVEIDSSFYNLPQLATASRWREEAPKGFEYALKAWQLVTHPASSPTYRRLNGVWTEKQLARCGHFKDTPEVASAWERTAAAASALRARVVLFQTPRSFYPNADHLRDMYRFFKGIRRGSPLLAWEPRGRVWEDKLVNRVVGDLGLTHACDPLADAAQGHAPWYYRLHGAYEGGRIAYDHRYTDAELGLLHTRCAGRNAWVFFNNAAMFDDAGRFLGMS